MTTVREAALGPDNSLHARIWRQAVEGLDVDRLLPTREKRAKGLAKKLDKPLDRNGWRGIDHGAGLSL